MNYTILLDRLRTSGLILTEEQYDTLLVVIINMLCDILEDKFKDDKQLELNFNEGETNETL